MNYITVIIILLLFCIILLGGIIAMGFMVSSMLSQEASIEIKTNTKEEKTSETKTTTTNDSLPVYPRNNPVYQSPRTTSNPEFQQIGTLINDNSDDPIVLPLFGRPMPGRRDRWEYYTATDKQYMLRIPIMFEEKDCLEEIGCREVYSKDTVFIPAYKKEFKVNLYKYRDQTSN